MAVRKPWLADRIAVNARAARGWTCPRCGSLLLVGLDEDMCALPAAVDAEPVSPADELRALMTGRWSYDLAGHELVRRDRWRLAGPRRRPVHLEHRCLPMEEAR